MSALYPDPKSTAPRPVFLGITVDNLHTYFMIFVAFGALSNALFNWLLIPYFSIEGAAVATVGSQLLTNFFVWRAMDAVNPFRHIKHLYVALGATLAMVIVTILALDLALPFLVIVALGVISYVAALFLLREPLLTEVTHILRQPQG